MHLFSLSLVEISLSQISSKIKLVIYLCPMYKQISSTHNKIVKQYLQLSEKSRERKKQGLFVIEGKREISLAIRGGIGLETVLFSAEIFEGDISALPLGNAEVLEISTEVYQKLAYRTGTEGILAIAKSDDHSLNSLKFEKNDPLVLIAEAPEKPGNIGALLRTADAANLDAVILANPRTDLYNPNIVRSSVGTLFTNQLATASTEDIIAYLKENNFAIYSAILQEAQSYLEVDYSGPCALVVGTEADGLSAPWRGQSNANVIIPMEGEIDSMNVSVAAGILIFEAKRQRNLPL